VLFMGDAPAAGTDVFGANDGLTQVIRRSSADGWGDYWSGVAVVVR